MLEKYPLSKINENLVKISDIDKSQDFVAICSYLDNARECFHSGLIICVNNDLFLFHYTAVNVELINTLDLDQNQEIVFKKLDIIHELDAIAFLGFCEELLQRGVHPIYGFVFNDSFYDLESQTNFLINAEHDITTCSGFCIKVIRGFLYNHPEYLKLTDWDAIPFQNLPERLRDYMRKILTQYAQDVNVTFDELFNQNELKRITPLELLASAYFTNLAIRKSSIDSIVETLYDSVLNVA